jgi:putative ABC transport system substrate-binding protein
MRRREFASLAIAAAVWAMPACAQPPLIGVLGSASPGALTEALAAFAEGLNDAGYVIGKHAAIEYRWAENQYDRLPGLAAELIRLNPAVIVASGGPASALAAQKATSTIPIVFPAVSDPVELGLVTSLARPGGNVTGISALTTELDPKRLELLREVTPAVERVGVLVNPNRPSLAVQVLAIEAAAQTLGQHLIILPVGTEAELSDAFATLRQRGAGALLVSADPFFASRREQIIALAGQYRLPAVYQWREFALAGGLLSYGTSLPGVYGQAGAYVARILKGARPADLPVERPTKFELVVNLKTAKALGVAIPQAILARADEVIE